MIFCSRILNRLASSTRLLLSQLVMIVVIAVICTKAVAAGPCEEPSYPDQFPDFTHHCENAAPIVFDKESSVKTLDHSDAGTVMITGGKNVYTWTISGSGFFFDSNFSKTTLQNVTSQTVTVFTDEGACGVGRISVTDGCTTAEYSVSSTDGRWGEEVGGGWGQRYGVDEFIPGKIILCGVEGTNTYNYSASNCLEADNGIYKQKICYASIGGCGTASSGCSPDPVGLCNDHCAGLKEAMPEVGEAVNETIYFTGYKVIEYQQCFTNMPEAEVSYYDFVNNLGYKDCGCYSYAIFHAAYQQWECR